MAMGFSLCVCRFAAILFGVLYVCTDGRANWSCGATLTVRPAMCNYEKVAGSVSACVKERMQIVNIASVEKTKRRKESPCFVVFLCLVCSDPLPGCFHNLIIFENLFYK